MSTSPGATDRGRLLHRYLGTHSLLIGLLPFFVPVYFWELGLDLAGLCVLVGCSGLAFSVALGPWQRLACGTSLRRLIGASFATEILLVALVALAGELLAHEPCLPTGLAESTACPDGSAAGGALLAMAILVGLASGLYNAFYWTTQRALFAAASRENDSGRRYANLQIIVAVFLKIGILAGGLLIDADRIVWILALSALSSAIATAWLARDAGAAPLVETRPISLREGLAFRDKQGSARIFVLDGPFLYLESHFWTLSLFLLVAEDHSRLGLVVVVLAALFAIAFVFVRNRIDRTAVDTVYRTSVVLYALSWLLRVFLDDATSMSMTVTLLLGVTFCSSLFRMTFNKRFFDLARAAGDTANRSGSAHYLVIKSQVSQLWIAVIFLPLGCLLAFLEISTSALLTAFYALAAVASLGYLRYRRAAPDGSHQTASGTSRRTDPAEPQTPR